MEEWLGVRISTELMEALKELATKDGRRSVSSVARQLLTEGVNRHYKQLSLVGFPRENQTEEEQPAAQMQRAGVGVLPALDEMSRAA